jgi:DNA-binding MarR family transcriptional regulator
MPFRPIGPNSAQHPLFRSIHRGARNYLEIGASLDADAEELSAPRLSKAEVASQLPNLQDKTTLAPFNESDLENPEFLSAAAAEMYRMRRARDHLLPKGLAGEPAWDIFLALYSEEPGKMTVSSVCYGSGVPQSTALRWISHLEHKGLVERVQHPRDEKVILLSLTDEGRKLVEDAVRAMLRAFRF